MILGKAIYYSSSAVLLEAGAELTESYINRLKLLGISEVYIKDEISQDIIINDVVNEQTRLEAIDFIRNTMYSYSSGNSLYNLEVLEIVEKIIDEILSLDEVIINLIDIKTCDNYTFLHSVNVCILSIITGAKLNLSYNDLKELGVGALLHDIGKVMVPPDILQKNSTLTDEEYEIIKQHSLLGYEILKKIPRISEASALVALCHHERYDGNGYISGLKKDEIHIFSRIVAITDIFDALTSDRIYRKKISINQAIDYMTVIAAPSLDANVLSCFTKIIPPFPIGTGVILNTGEKGVVIRLNENFPTRPIIRLVFNSDGSKKIAYYEVDLSKQTEYFISTTSELVK
jgi:HD-GYP domain-containing protein (c-di-GMP phosphodiesterase class II)